MKILFLFGMMLTLHALGLFPASSCENPPGKDRTGCVELRGIILERPLKGVKKFAAKSRYKTTAEILNDVLAVKGSVISQTNFASTGTDGFTSISRVIDDLSSLESILTNRANCKLMSRPYILGSNQVVATFFISDSVPYICAVFRKGTTLQKPRKTTAVFLELTPSTDATDRIAFQICQRVEKLTADKTGISRKFVSAQSRVEVSTLPGETIVLTGCKVKFNKVPTELIVLIQPSSIPKPISAASLR